MGIFDRFRPADQSRGRTYEAQPVEPTEDEQALARYRYMLKTAPPETIEQAHLEAFARLTPQQRQLLLEQLRAEMPEAERAYATENPQTLARLATRAEMRDPAPWNGCSAASRGRSRLRWDDGQQLAGQHGRQRDRHDDRAAFSRKPRAGPAIWAKGGRTRHDGTCRPSSGSDGGDFAGGFDDIGGDFDGGSFDV